MAQQPTPGTLTRATGPGQSHSEPPDEAGDVLAKSIRVGAGAGTREIAMAIYGPEHNVTPAQKVGASAIAGAVSVVPFGLLLRGPRSVIPGSVLFSLLGAGGQSALNRWPGSETSAKKSNGWFTSKWSPMTKLSDEEYKVMLEEKILRVEADLAILDESKAALLAGDDSESKTKAAKESSSKA
ncbi:hypothetical protein DHEL01_v202554 [Diaporthe helianthi]|uniref:Uncharacterized protein n=1 Tax=Diaporthe helianthi TaxID=158607 RepID=A0A2P5I967_DIAHE|nr:hypothetical protein DHEL01_v202554 [Diaporthe helianthi]